MRVTNRWVLLAAFLLSTSINYLDRLILAYLAPLVMSEFRLNNREYGLLGSAFSITYAAGAPLAGLLIDRLGLTRGMTFAVALWSLAGILTGLGTGLPSLVAFRALLGLAESGGIPASGKAVRLFMRPEERALGAGLNQLFIGIAFLAAPPAAVGIASRYGWRTAFIATGAAGFLWIALWRLIAPPAHETATPAAPPRELLRDRRVWAIAAANAFSMVLFVLWTYWPVLYLTKARGASLEQAAWLTTGSALLSTVGALAGGWLSLQFMKRGAPAVKSRLRVCLIASLGALSTAAIPWLPNAAWAAAGIGLSFFAVAAFSANLYVMPLDLFAPGHAALAISLLTTSFGVMQAGVSVLFGAVIDHYGYTPLCVAASLTPLCALLLLRWTGVDRQP